VGAERRRTASAIPHGRSCAHEPHLDPPLRVAALALGHAIERGEPGVHEARDGLEARILAIVNAARALS
jgi:hypothetical protein